MVKFEADKHKYTSDKGVYTSVTTLVKKFTPVFDAITISENYAKKHPEKTAKEWREEWKKIGELTAQYGTDRHAELEEETKKLPNCQVSTVRVDGNITQSIDSLKDLEDGVYPEMLVWDNEYMIAGQIDRMEKTGNKVDLIDYKTYKKVDVKSFYNPKLKKYKMMLEPLQALQDCNYNHAALQLTTYAYILERQGYQIGSLTLLHIDREGKKTPYTVSYKGFKLFVSFMLNYKGEF